MQVLPVNVYRVRRARGMSMLALARAARMSPNRVSDIEHRRGLPPSDGQKGRLARALGLTVADLERVHDPDAEAEAARQLAEDPRRVLWTALDHFRATAAAAARKTGNDPATAYAIAAEQITDLAGLVARLDLAGKFKADTT